MVDVINVRKMVDVDAVTVEDVLKVKYVEEAYVIIAENMIVSVVSLVMNVVTVENVEGVVLVQDVVVQASVEVGPEDIKTGSLFVLFFANLSDK